MGAPGQSASSQRRLDKKHEPSEVRHKGIWGDKQTLHDSEALFLD